MGAQQLRDQPSLSLMPLAGVLYMRYLHVHICTLISAIALRPFIMLRSILHHYSVSHTLTPSSLPSTLYLQSATSSESPLLALCLTCVAVFAVLHSMYRPTGALG